MDRTAAIERMTAGQRHCLVLVAQMMNSKEIGRHLGISPHTVDERLKRATASLGASSRFEAARIYGKAIDADRTVFGWSDYQALVYQTPQIHDFGAEVGVDRSAGIQGRRGDGAGAELHEAVSPYFGVPGTDQSKASFWSAFLEGSSENRLSPAARLACIILIAVLAVLSMGALVSVAEGLSRLS